MGLVQQVDTRWCSATCIVAGTGPSLERDANAVESYRLSGVARVIAVNDAWRLLPSADILYACDAAWWNEYDGVPDFKGERWSSHNELKDEKSKCAAKWGLNLVRGERRPYFSVDPTRIHYGDNSGFQAINLAIHFGAVRILLVGFDMQIVGGKRHFFGQHPKELRNTNPSVFIPQFDIAARKLPPNVEIINCTLGSRLKCFPIKSLNEAMQC